MSFDLVALGEWKSAGTVSVAYSDFDPFAWLNDAFGWIWELAELVAGPHGCDAAPHPPCPAGPGATQVWMQAALDAFMTLKLSPLDAARTLAMQGVAIHDALAGIEGRDGVLASLHALPGADAEAAVAGAAHRILSTLFPQARAEFDAVLARELTRIADGAGETNGLAHGRAIAEAVLALRARDGADGASDYTPLDGALGHWEPDSAATTPLRPHWGGVELFMKGHDLKEFEAAPPPALTSVEYAAAYNETKDWSGRVNRPLKPGDADYDEWEISKFWADPDGTYTPPGHWMRIAMDIAAKEGLSMADTATLAAQVGCALSDAGVAAWKAKYQHDFWRPDHAIWNGDRDGNPLTAGDPNWRPCVANPPFPEYISGHSTFSAAAATVLGRWFGEDYAFSSSYHGLAGTTKILGIDPDTTRSFGSFMEAAHEAGMSRIYGGIHFQFANQEGLKVGAKVGAATMDAYAQAQQTDLRAPVLLFNALDGDRDVLSGLAFDDRAGVSSVSAVLDGWRLHIAAQDAQGRFSINLDDAFFWARNAAHRLELTVTDAAGNRTVTQMQLERHADDSAGGNWSVTGLDGSCWVNGVELQDDWMA